MESQPRCERCGRPRAGVDDHCSYCLTQVSLALAFSPAADSSDALEDLPRAFGDYILDAKIGQGGMGLVYRARQWKLNRVVAIKMLLGGQFAGKEALRRFKTEAEAAAKLRHPNIITLYEVGEADGLAYFSMEYVEGRTLAEVVQKETVSFDRSARWMRDIADAVEHAHRHGILHRDLKPSNILIDPFDQPRVTDFGLARHSADDSTLTLTGQALGSPNYMPPEQAIGAHDKVGPRSDVYGLGALLYHLLTGRPPYLADSMAAVLAQVQNADPIPPQRLNPSIPEDLQTLALKCLEKEPDRRLPSAQSLVEELDRFLLKEPIHSRATTPLERIWRWCRRRPAIAGLGLALAMALLVGGLGIFLQWQRAEHEAAQALSTAASARRNEYAADVKAASDAIQRGDLAEARRWLDRHLPTQGQEDLRGFEWYFLSTLALGSEKAELTEHTSTVTATAVSPDGRWLASASLDQTLCLWDAASLKLSQRKSLECPGWVAEFTPDSRALLCPTPSETLSLLDVPSLKTIRSFPGRLGALAKEKPRLVISQGSPWFWETAGEVSVWNYQTGEREQTIPLRGHHVAISADGRWVAVSEEPAKIAIWDLEKSSLAAELTGRDHTWSLQFSPDSRYLAVASNDKRIQLWDLRQNHGTNQGLRNATVLSSAPQGAIESAARADAVLEEGHSLRAWSVAFSPDGTQLLSTSSDRSIRLWSVPDLKPVALWQGHHDEVWSAAFFPSGDQFISGGKDARVMLWDKRHSGPADLMPSDLDFAPRFTPDGGELVTHHRASGQTAKTFSSLTNEGARSFTDFYVYLGFTPNGRQFVSNPSNEGQLTLRSLTTLEIDGEVKLEKFQLGPPVEFECQGVTPDGSTFFAVQTNGMLSLWHLPDGRLEARIVTRSGPRYRGVLSPDHRWFAISHTFPYDVFLYEIGSGKEQVLQGHTEYVKGIQFSPDSRELATAGVDGKIRLWQPSSGRLIRTLTGHLQEVSDVAYSPDGKTLASIEGGTALKLWRLDTAREVASMNGPRFGWRLAFSPDGQALAVDRSDTKAEVFRAMRSAKVLSPPRP